MATDRINISNKFENGDIPSQNDFGEIFESFIHKDEDKANIQMVEAGTDNQHYVTPALLRAGLQNVNSITGNCYFPLKENFDDFNGTTIFLKESPINFSIQAFKNGQLLREDEDYTANYDSAILTFKYPVTTRNIEIDYWYKNLDGISDAGTTIGSRPYKVYTALLTQSGTFAPVATVLENTLGGTVVWSRNNEGKYSATLAGAFTENCTTIFLTNPFLKYNRLRGSRQDNNTVFVYNEDRTPGLLLDNIPEHASIEIRVYKIKPKETPKPRAEFISTWKTDNLSNFSSTANQVRLPLLAAGVYDMVVDWGDDTTSTITAYNSPDVTHTYAAAGTYTISISGVCTGWRFNTTGDRNKILTISQWGRLKLGTNQGNYFYGCNNLELSGVTDTLDLTDVTSLSYAFYACGKITTINKANEWILSSVTDMSYMFAYTNLFNDNISSWDTSNVTKMQGVFRSAIAFDQSIGNWNTSKVTDISTMLYAATKFNQSISNWDTSAVTDMSYVLGETKAFNQPIANWNTSNVTKMTGVFYNATAFNQPIESWDTSKVTDMLKMFQLTGAFNQPIGNWKTSKVTNMSYMFSDAKAFDQPIENWNTGSVTDMSYMFQLTKVFNQNIGTWDTSKVANMSGMFSQNKIFNKEIGNWNTGSVTTMAIMFYDTLFNQNIDSWDTSNVTIMSSIFSSATSFNKPIGSWNTGKVTAMNSMFQYANSFNQPIASWNISKVSNMNMIFFGALKFNQPLESWDTSNVTNMSYMFADTGEFDQSIGKWDTSKVTNMSFMFRYSKFNQPIGNWNTANVTDMSSMLGGATKFNQNIGLWNISKVNNFSNFLGGKTPTTFSSTNLNAIYNGWSTRTVLPSQSISFGTAKYTASTAASRTKLTEAPNNWIITDGRITA